LKDYQHLFFDLDHTLWDFERNTAEALSDLYKMFDLSKWEFFTCEDLIRSYHEVNDLLWKEFSFGNIDMDELRKKRFPLVLKKLGMKQKDIPEQIGTKYLEISPRKSYVMPYAKEALEYLKKKYHLHIITNGFHDVQHTKLKSAGLYHYFDEIITSDSAGSRKPDKGIFEYALRLCKARREKTAMIGDNPDTDMQGAINANIDQIYFNPKRIKRNFPVTHEIFSLKELMKIL
jgi:putative hydrolase of the HAD superfamily